MQSFDRSEITAETQTSFHIITRFEQPGKQCTPSIRTSDERSLLQPISTQVIPVLPAESLNLTNDSVNHDEVSFHIPTQRFRHIVSSTTPKSNGNQLVRECAVCLSLKPESEYRALLSEDCQHTYRTVCYGCVYHTIIVLLGSSISDSITCPELICPAKLTIENVRDILMYYQNIALLNKYDTYLTSVLLEKMPEFIWCVYGCGSGQLHPNFTPKVDCVVCNGSACFFHRVPWHEGFTCEEYDIYGRSDEAITLKYLKAYAKQCPKCKVHIEKNKGCDHMTCTRCGTEFCWNCLAEFGAASSLYTCAHKATCVYFQTTPILYERTFDEFNYRRALRRRLRSRFCTIL